jgi:hypothetical protein
MMVTLKIIKLVALLSVFSLVIQKTNAQTILTKHKWQQRILLLLDKSKSSKTMNAQLELLGNLDADYDERKLLVLLVYQKAFQYLNGPKTTKYDPSLYKELSSESERFNAILIGLDGGVKLRRPTPIPRADLFALIDRMPMRQNELKNKH